MTLTNKKTGRREQYNIYAETDLSFLKKPCKKGNGTSLLDFNMKKLEIEYDYDTDEEQLCAAKFMLRQESYDAIHFYAEEGDPVLLVENLYYQCGTEKLKQLQLDQGKL